MLREFRPRLSRPLPFRFADRFRLLQPFLVAIVTLAVCGALGTGCKSTPSPTRIVEPDGTMTARINDTLCTVMPGSAAVARLVSGPSGSLVVDGMLVNPRGELVGTIHLEVHGAVHTGAYYLSELTIGSEGAISGNAGALVALLLSWTTDSSHQGTLTITEFDPARARLAGTFAFDCISLDGGGLKTIRDGTFSALLQ